MVWIIYRNSGHLTDLIPKDLIILVLNQNHKRKKANE